MSQVHAMGPPPDLETAVIHHRSGRLDEAEAIYRRVLAVNPNNADAIHLLGLIENHRGRPASAVELIQRAIALNPKAPDYHDNLGLVFQSLRRLDEALECHRKAAELNPRHPKAHFNAGNILFSKSRYPEAVEEYRIALKITPDSAEAHQNLGTALHRTRKLEEAEASLRRAVTLRPNFPDAHNNLGVVLAERMQYDAAIAEYSEAVKQRPDFAPALANLGAALRVRGHTGQAINALRRSAQLAPDAPETLNNLGIALKDVGKLDEAAKVFHRCIAIRPTMRDALNNLANVHKECGDIPDAIACYARSMAVAAVDPRIHSNLTYTLQFHAGYDDESLYREQRRWNEIHAKPLASSIRPHDNDRDPDRRLKIGYVSPYFYTQAESFFVAPLLENHDQKNFEIHCYASVIKPDHVTTRFKQGPYVWHDVLTYADAELAEQIRRDRIDILMDLAMHMSHNRLMLFARKPAPVQVTWLAYPGGTGLDAIDYRITDGYMDPPDKPATYYREQSIRLEGCWCCFDPMGDQPPVAPRPEGPIRFGSINNACKNNPPLLNLWARVLHAVPGSTMLILASGQDHRNKLRAIFGEAGIEPNRLEFVDRQGRTPYLRQHDQIDICLDTLPYNGITTTCDALWMGVPVITLIGRTASGRAGLSILSTVGLTELIAATEDEFVKIAVDLAADRPRMAQYRSTLRQRMLQSPVMDGAGFARRLEAAYRDMWRKWCSSPAQPS